MMRLSHAIIGGIVFALLAIAAPQCAAQQATIYKIEEDWEMVVAQPEPANCSPQITFFTSPSVDADDTYFQLQMNYAADEGFESGGFHVAAVQGNAIVDEARSENRQTLSSGGDHIRWTSVMASIDGKLLFAVKDGHGHQWGEFGGPEYLVRIESSPHTDLSRYYHQHSLDSVDIGFGANRVSSVTLKTVRLFYTDGNTVTLTVNGQL